MKDNKYIRHLKKEIKKGLEIVDGNTKDGEIIVEFLYGAITGFHRRNRTGHDRA